MYKRIDQVNSYFSQTDHYLRAKGSFNIQIRAEMVESFVGDRKFKCILDVGCGDGALSLPLLRQDNQLLLLDISSAMLSIARSRIPDEFSGNVKMINEDVMDVEFASQSFDLILCLGVLAHVSSPTDVIAKIASLLKPNGSVIVQNSNSQHFVRLLSSLPSAMRTIFPSQSKPVHQFSYAFNQLSDSNVRKLCSNNRLKLINTYKYNIHLPGMGRVYKSDSLYNEKMYKLVKKIYGGCSSNRFSWLGVECIYHFIKI